jgi:MYXO-CTERM domain-containing protein
VPTTEPEAKKGLLGCSSGGSSGGSSDPWMWLAAISALAFYARRRRAGFTS